ncbi:ankyrin repeat-containing domain protein [Aspergillus karnatakaensis]|uniref:ankyrin repeat domain-containing protein n=1 Tax=Aspergillus karnatakaensis TaxID=1810916 RepID=UPI003CCDAA18
MPPDETEQQKREADNSALLSAIHTHDTAATLHLLQNGAYPDGNRDSCSPSPLSEAILSKQVEIVRSFVDHGVYPRICELGSTELHHAASTGDVSNPSYDSSPAHYAAARGHLECLKLLGRFDAESEDGVPDVDAKDGLGWTLLHTACAGALSSVGPELVSNVDSDSNSQLQSRWQGAVEVVRYLCAKGADVTALSTTAKETPLYLAACAGNIGVIRELLRYSISSSSDEAKSSIANILTQRNRFGETALHAAAYHCPLSALEMLVDAGGDIHARSYSNATVVHRAAEAGRVDSVRWILNHGSLTVDEKGSHGWTPLHYAVNANRVEMVKFLLESKADVHAVSNPGNHTPLHRTASYHIADGEEDLSLQNNGQDDPTVMRLLIEHGANIHALADSTTLVGDWARGEALHEWTYGQPSQEDSDPDPESFHEDVYPLHCAVASNNINLAKLLLGSGADINARTTEAGSTALHLASVEYTGEMLVFLIENGADWKIEDYHGRKMVHFLLYECRREPERVKKFFVEQGLYEAEMEAELNAVWPACRLVKGVSGV